jgi:hypothetical protein
LYVSFTAGVGKGVGNAVENFSKIDRAGGIVRATLSDPLEIKELIDESQEALGVS